MINHLKQHFGSRRTGGHGGLDIARHIGPGLLVTVGFIDPGNWASNMAAGSQFGYALLWIVTLSTIMLIVLQHNAAHLASPRAWCLAEATTRYLPRFVGRTVLASAYLATIATAMAEVLGGADRASNALWPARTRRLHHRRGSIDCHAHDKLLQTRRAMDHRLRGRGGTLVFSRACTSQGRLAASRHKLDHTQYAHRLGRDYRKCPRGGRYAPQPLPALRGHPTMHFEGQGEQVIEERLRYELFDTLFSMGVGWAINSAMVILAATTFFAHGIVVDDLAVAAATLSPILGPASSIIFAVALLFAGISSSVTAGMAAGTITAGMFDEEYDIHDRHSSIGVAACFVGAVAACLVVPNPFEGLIWSQALLSLQLPITVFVLIRLTSSPRVMGKYANSCPLNALLVGIGAIVTILDVVLLTGV